MRAPFQNIGLDRFEGGSVVGKALRAEMGFELKHQVGAVRFAGAFEGHAALAIGRMRRHCAKIRATQAFHPRQCLPIQLVEQLSLRTTTHHIVIPSEARNLQFGPASKNQAPSSANQRAGRQ